MTATGRYLAFDVGCYECGEPSGIIGIFDTKDEAQQACDAALVKQEADWHGQHSMEVHDLLDTKHWSEHREVTP